MATDLFEAAALLVNRLSLDSFNWVNCPQDIRHRVRMISIKFVTANRKKQQQRQHDVAGLGLIESFLRRTPTRQNKKRCARKEVKREIPCGEYVLSRVIVSRKVQSKKAVL
ncbi:MAG: hypothetical protein ACI9UN_004584 [Granulosicoccus sp.]|jgi:hypothetical protein